MENVHVLNRQIDGSGEFLPYSQAYRQEHELERTHHLVGQLQKTLELSKIVNIFSVEASRITPFAGLQFHSPEGVIEMSGSKATGQHHAFDLEVDGERLGQLIYFCANSLSSFAKQQLAKLHSVLVYPLRNALMFYRVTQLATKDSLTGLNNRSQFDECLVRKLERSRRYHRHFGLMLIDLDNFKQVNDLHGHISGDHVLTEFAQILAQSIRGTDSVYRFGGDEFAVLVDDDKVLGSETLAKRIQQRVGENILLSQHSVTCSIGASLSRSQDCVESIFERADKALYSAKTNGRNCYKVD